MIWVKGFIGQRGGFKCACYEEINVMSGLVSMWAYFRLHYIMDEQIGCLINTVAIMHGQLLFDLLLLRWVP